MLATTNINHASVFKNSAKLRAKTCYVTTENTIAIAYNAADLLIYVDHIIEVHYLN
jgi:hypothetical protein